MTASVSGDGQQLRMGARGTLEVKSPYAISMGTTLNELIDLGFSVSGDWYERERVSVGVTIDLY